MSTCHLCKSECSLWSTYYQGRNLIGMCMDCLDWIQFAPHEREFIGVQETIISQRKYMRDLLLKVETGSGWMMKLDIV